jgi:hypothetical protein
MTKRTGILALLFFIYSGVYGDSPILQSYKQIFSKADLSAKAEILYEAAGDRQANEFIGQFYEYALQFALQNSELLKNDSGMINLIDIAVKGLRDTDYTESLDTLWQLFPDYHNSAAGAEILITMGKLGKGNHHVIGSINHFLAGQNVLYRSGGSVNYALVSACITAIHELGDSSSYPVLFAVLCAGYPEVIAFEASGTMELIPGNYKQFLFDVIEKKPPDEKFAAFKAGIYSSRLGAPDRGQLAELALEQCLVYHADEENADMTALRYAAVLALTPLRWTRASALAIRHYYRVLADYQQESVFKDHLIEAIALLGAVGNSEAALILALQLGLVNSRAERTGLFDMDTTLAMVKALGLIGDKAAFDQLLNIRNLPYPENIQIAAKEAIDHLKW